MKKGFFRVLCLMMCAALLCGAAGTASAAGKKTDGAVYGVDEPFFCWIYATDTIPEGVTVMEASEELHLYQSSYTSESNKAPDEYLFDCSVEFVSGDERLKDAIVFRKTEEGDRMEIAINNDVIRQPGEAVFHFAFEGEKLRSEFDRTLRVVDYNEYPPFTVLQDKAEFIYHPGDVLDESRITKGTVRSNIGTISGQISHEGAAGAFADLGYKGPYIRFMRPSDLRKCFAEEHNEEKRTTTRTAENAGTVFSTVHCEFANVRLEIPVTLNVLSYNMEGPGMIRPGETAEYTIEDLDASQGRSFAWSLEGEGAELQGSGNAVTVTAGNETGAVILTLTPDNGEPAIQKQISISDGVLGICQTTRVTLRGFAFNLITDNEAGFTYGRLRDGSGYAALLTDADTGKTSLYITYTYGRVRSFMENPEDAVRYYEEQVDSQLESADMLDSGEMEIDGHPARYYIFRKTMDDGTESVRGIVVYVRNNTELMIAVNTYGTEPGKAPGTVTASDLKTVTADMAYDPSVLEIVQADGVITIYCKEETHTVTAGKKLNLSVGFPNPAITYNQDYNPVTWSVVDAETGEPSADVTITEKGVLSAGKNISSVLKLKVVAKSDVFHTTGEYELTVMPVIKKVSVDPAEIFLYEGSDAEAAVAVKLDPDIVPEGLTWTPKKDGVADMKVKDDGTAVFKALAAGKIQVTVKEPGGKSATLNVNVVEPVTAVTLSAKGAAKPGGTVTVTPATEPKKPGNAALEWSLDVGEDVATINAKGQVKISKEAAAGTKITVTCKALGAPEPVVATLELEVAEK